MPGAVRPVALALSPVAPTLVLPPAIRALLQVPAQAKLHDLLLIVLHPPLVDSLSSQCTRVLRLLSPRTTKSQSSCQKIVEQPKPKNQTSL